MSTSRNMRRCQTASWWPLLALLIAATTITASPAQAEEPTLDETVTAFLKARQWVDAFDLPDVESADARVEVEHGLAYCVILRRHGRVLGVGLDAAGFRDPTLAPLGLRRALGRALGEVLQDEAVAAMDEDNLTLVGQGLTIELEIAGRPRPLLGRTWTDAERRIAPGMDGIAMRRDDRWAVEFPAQLRQLNVAGRTASKIPGLALGLDLGAVTLASINQRDDVGAYTFRPRSFAQSTPDGHPFETYRGDRLEPLRPCTHDEVHAFARDLAQRLQSGTTAMRRGDLTEAYGITGDYLATADRYEPVIASPRDQALCAMALGKFANTPGVAGEHRSLAREYGERLLTDLAVMEVGEIGPLQDIVSCAAIILAFEELPGALDFAPAGSLRHEASRAMLRQFTATEGFRQNESIVNEKGEVSYQPPAITPAGHALLAQAMIALCAERPRDFHPGLGSAALRHAWSHGEGAGAVAMLPWIAWAEQGLAELGAGRLESPGRLRDIHELVQSTRIERLIDDQHDLAGGLALTSRYPTAACLPSAALLAWALDQPAIVPDAERDRAVRGMLLTMRFLRQLQVTDRNAWACRNPERAMGGVRQSCWDGTQPVAAQAMALMVAADLLKALDE